MICPKCGQKPKAIKTEEATDGHARLLECNEHGRFWSLERLWRWVVKVAGNGSPTAGQRLGNGWATAIAVAEPLEGGGGVSSLSSLSSLSDDPNPIVVDSPNRARALRKGRGDATEYPPEFETIWAGCVPHKGNKHPAFEQWLKYKPDPTLTIDVYKQWLQADEWKRGYIPHLRKWLRSKGWETPPTDADLSGPTNGTRQVVPFAVAADQGRTSRALADKLKRLQGELSPEPPPPDPRKEYAARAGGTK